MNTKEIMKIAKNMAIELVDKTEGPGDAMLITFQIQDIIKMGSKKNLEKIIVDERIRAKTAQRQTRKPSRED